MYTKSKIQLIKESLSKKHDFECGLTELMDKYNITDAIFVIRENINEVKLGYFDTVASYDTLNEAIKNCDINTQGIRIIENNEYQVGTICNNLSQCNSDKIIDIETLKEI